jgi:ribosome-binding protein aMBF1 (putative translation factor)
MMSPDQCRASRALLGWSVQDLATAASLGTASIKRFEAGQTMQAATVAAIAGAITSAGIVLLSAGAASPNGGEGVRRARD